jgi:hypothetical protein
LSAPAFSPFLTTHSASSPPQVRSLDCSQCSELADVSALGRVHTLKLSFCRQITNVSALGRVAHLDLSHCEGVTDVGGLTGVAFLNITGAGVPPQATLKRLRRLQMNGDVFEYGRLAPGFGPRARSLAGCRNVRAAGRCDRPAAAGGLQAHGSDAVKHGAVFSGSSRRAHGAVAGSGGPVGMWNAICGRTATFFSRVLDHASFASALQDNRPAWMLEQASPSPVPQALALLSIALVMLVLLFFISGHIPPRLGLGRMFFDAACTVAGWPMDADAADVGLV